MTSPLQAISPAGLHPRSTTFPVAGRYVVVCALAAIALSGVYLGIVSLAESPQHAFELFWQDRWLVLPILLAFGVQAGLFAFVRSGAHLAGAAPRAAMSPAGDAPMARGSESVSVTPTSEATPYFAGAAGASTAAGGGLSTVAMVACCAHHVTDVLPILGVSLAATFLTAWKTPLMGLGLAANLAGIAVMLLLLRRDQRRAGPPIDVEVRE